MKVRLRKPPASTSNTGKIIHPCESTTNHSTVKLEIVRELDAFFLLESWLNLLVHPQFLDETFRDQNMSIVRQVASIQKP
jgi:hypothetical protein